ncbi:hypothetical protein [Acetobacter aceti]|uniref:Uncharacterized protein n=1 Tax=Acetobacter aceti TaxID=435 RepID=A0A6S6PJE7_ACEAC|nr:hypothetical protein [Acetobacter aceti]BCI67429.1 hypothetical protein AAJCM20276_20530 [Acetobacter aceti]
MDKIQRKIQKETEKKYKKVKTASEALTLFNNMKSFIFDNKNYLSFRSSESARYLTELDYLRSLQCRLAGREYLTGRI